MKRGRELRCGALPGRPGGRDFGGTELGEAPLLRRISALQLSGSCLLNLWLREEERKGRKG